MTKGSNSRNVRRLEKKQRDNLEKQVKDKVAKTLKEAQAKANEELDKANKDLQKRIRDGMVDAVTQVEEPKVAKLPLKERLEFKVYMVKQLFKKMWFTVKCKLGFGSAIPTMVCTGFNPDTGGIALIIHMADTTQMTVELGYDAACTIGQELLQYIHMGSGGETVPSQI